jgi:Ca2+-binding EF-hand superfamily protein
MSNFLLQLRSITVKLGGEPMTDAAVIKAIEVLDTDKNGTIEFEEFQVWWDNDNNDVKIGGCAASLYQ